MTTALAERPQFTKTPKFTETVATAPVAPTVPVAPSFACLNVAEGLWSCTIDGEFAGSIEFTGGRFEAVSSTGTRLGRSHSLAGAKEFIQGGTPDSTDVLRWGDERRAFTIAWGALLISGVASIALALQLFV